MFDSPDGRVRPQNVHAELGVGAGSVGVGAEG
jgi:hypothetical protein